MKAPLALAVLALCLAVAPSRAQDEAVNAAIEANLGDHLKYDAVIQDLQTAVARQDGKAVAALVSYPITVKIKGKPTTITGPEQFAEHFSDIFTPTIARAVVEQKHQDLFVNYQGVMFGNGQVWINGICKDAACTDFDVKVITIQEAPS